MFKIPFPMETTKKKSTWIVHLVLKETKKTSCADCERFFMDWNNPHRAWCGRFTKSMKGFWLQSEGDHTLFTKHWGK